MRSMRMRRGLYEGLGFARLKAPEEATFFETMKEMREGLGDLHAPASAFAS
jgi:hypothetical protein